MQDEVGQTSAFTDFNRLVCLGLELIENSLIVLTNQSLCLHDIVVAVLIKDVFLVLIDILPLILFVLLIEASRSLEFSDLPFGLLSHLPLLLLCLNLGISLLRLVEVGDSAFLIGVSLGDIFLDSGTT